MPERSPPPEPTPEERADAIIEALHSRGHSGERPSLDAILAEHPDLAGLLQPRFATIQMLWDAFDELRSSDVGPFFPPIGRGTRLGPYRLGGPLGAGGMGTVYLARVEEATARLEMGRKVAVKVIHPHLLLRSEVVERFKREAEIGRRVDHENVVATLDTGCVAHGGVRLHYLVTEYVEGRTLRELQDEMRRVPEALLVAVAGQTAAGLGAIHRAGIVHRDLKPANILITKTNRVRVMDLGMARLVDASVQLTQDGEFAGSLLYAAPEHLRGEAVGPAADLYGLGLVLFELLAGVRPFTQEQIAGCLRNRIPPPPPRFEDRGVEVSAFLAAVVQTLLADTPESRFRSAEEVCEVLRQGEASAWWAARVAAGASVKAPLRIPVTRSVPLRGRTRELEQLRGIWRVGRRGPGAAVLVGGEVGIGKTRLLAELTSEIRDAETLYTTFGPSGGIGAITDALVDRYGSAGLEESLRPFLPQAPRLAASIAHFARHEITPIGDARGHGGQIASGLVRLLQGMAATGPLLWVFEELESASPEARAPGLGMARAAQDLRAVVVMTASDRPEEADLEALSRLERFERIRLSRLQDHDIRRILDELFEEDILGTPLGRAVVRKVDGVPFFLFELLRGLESRGTIEAREHGRYAIGEKTLPAELPANLRHVVRARLTRLTEDQRTLVDLAAVQGFQFDASLLADVLERPPIAVLRELAEIERRSGVIQTSGRMHRFDHPLLPEVVYAELAPELCLESHERLARARETRDKAADRAPEALAADTVIFLAHHHLRGPNPENARRYLRAALTHLAAAYREEEALDLSGRALATDGLILGADRVACLLQRSDQMSRIGKRPEALLALVEARELADRLGDPLLRAKTSLRLGQAQYLRGAVAAAKGTLEEAQALADDLDDPPLQAAVLTWLANVAKTEGRYVDALAHYDQGLARLETKDEPQQELATRVHLGLLLKNLNRLPEAVAQQERCITLALDLGDLRSEARATGDLGIALFRMGRFDEARACQQRRLNMAEELGDLLGEAHACGNLGNLCMNTGEFDEARGWHERDLAIMRELGDTEGERLATDNLAEACVLLGQRDEARSVIQEQIARCTAGGTVEGTRTGLARLAAINRDEGRYGDAEQHFRRAMELSGAAKDHAFLARLQARYAVALGELGETGPAVAMAQEAIESERSRSSSSETLGIALLHLGMVRLWSGSLEGAEAEIREALPLLGPGSFGHGRSTALALLGHLAVRRGETEEARQLFTKARVEGEAVRAGMAILPTVHGLLEVGDVDVETVVEVVEAWEQLVPAIALLYSRFTLFQHTKDEAHIREARRLLDVFVQYAPERCRTTMIDAVPVYRTIMDATL